jgi:hypothetical protein
LVNLETLKAKERTRSNSTLREPERVIESMPAGGNMDARMRSYWRRYLGQINRRSPIEKATSPLKVILSFPDLAKTSRQMDMLRHALADAGDIEKDERLDESQKRVNLRKTLKVAASAIWASHKSDVNPGD